MTVTAEKNDDANAAATANEKKEGTAGRKRRKELDIDFGSINANNVEQLRQVNVACFPVSYNDTFYKDVVNKRDVNDLSKFAYWNGYVIGAICARVEANPDGLGFHRLYIMTLGVLAAYRGRGAGKKLVQSLLDALQPGDDDPLAKTTKEEEPLVNEITLHVQISNQDAIRFYVQGFGFERGEMVEHYYKRVDPPHCYVLKKKIAPSWIRQV